MARKTRRRGRRVRITRTFRKVRGGSRKYHNGGHNTVDFKNGLANIQNMSAKTWSDLKNGIASTGSSITSGARSFGSNLSNGARSFGSNLTNGANSLGYKAKNALRIK
jgi:hypothetical protein